MITRFIVIFKVIIAASLFLINVQCIPSDLEKLINLDVPFHNQECSNWCGIACIQMWAHFDGFSVTQQEIANELGIGFNQATSPFDLETGIGSFTCSEGYCATRGIFEPGAQGDLIGATIYAIQDYVPSIMPFWMDHAVLIKGYKWREDENGRPLAIKVWFHDPNNLPNRTIDGGTLEIRFMPAPVYWVIIGLPDYVFEGIIGHDSFVLAGGTYYGGPYHYDPKDLVPDPNPN
ncbi:MAG: C39 family peptidase [Candidatus Aminicenantes bacterium]|nr:MAG: C39 family peptidase [Candidatus Aminicenantes bacterium]